MHRLEAMDVKLNGVTARTKPSSGRFDGLAGGVNLCLEEVLALTEHRGGIHDGAVLRGEQFGHLHHDGGTGGPWRAAPFLPCLHGGLNGQLYLFLANLVVGGEYVLVVVRTGYLACFTGAYLLAADDDGDVDNGVALPLKFFLKGDALWRASQIGLHRLIGREGECDDGIVHVSIVLKWSL